MTIIIACHPPYHVTHATQACTNDVISQTTLWGVVESNVLEIKNSS